MAAEIAEQERLIYFETVEKAVQEQIAHFKQSAQAAKDSGDKRGAIAYLKEQKILLEALDIISRLKTIPGRPPPKYHYASKGFVREISFPHLSDNVLEVEILNATGIKPPPGMITVDSYVFLTFPFPSAEAPQKCGFPVIKGTVDPVYNVKTKLHIDRKKPFLRFIERKKLTLDIYHKRWLLPDIPLGKAEVKLAPLLERAEIQEVCAVMEGRKNTGAQIEVAIRLRNPLSGKPDVRQIEENVLVFEDLSLPVTNPNPATLSLIDPPTTTTSTLANPTTTTTLTTSAISNTTLPANSISNPTNVATTTSNTNLSHNDLSSSRVKGASSTAKARPPSSNPPTPKRNSIKAAPTPSVVPLSTTNVPTPTTPTKAPTPATAPKSTEEAEEEEEESLDNIISNNVLEWEQAEITKKIALCKQNKQTIPDSLVDRKQLIDLKLQVLVIQVQTGKLTVEDYRKQLEDKIAEEKTNAKLLLKTGKKNAAKKALIRARIMTKELEENEADELEPEGEHAQ